MPIYPDPVMRVSGNAGEFTFIDEGKLRTTPQFRWDMERQLLCAGLPTADPHVVGALWNSAGVVKISAG